MKPTRITLGTIESIVDPKKVIPTGNGGIWTYDESGIPEDITIRFPHTIIKRSDFNPHYLKSNQNFLSAAESLLVENRLYLAEATYDCTRGFFGRFKGNRLKGTFYREISTTN
jgi:hypothetical protein